MNDAKRAQARAMLADGVGILKVARTLRCGSGTIQRIKREMHAAA